jgi:hypothetical protein
MAEQDQEGHAELQELGTAVPSTLPADHRAFVWLPASGPCEVDYVLALASFFYQFFEMACIL